MPSTARILTSPPGTATSFGHAERLHLARELHDVFAYSFATINVQAAVAVHLADDRPEQAVEALRAITEISGRAARELRAILGVMRSVERTEAPPRGLAALDDLTATLTGAGLPTTTVVSGRVRGLPLAVDRAAYRIVQEALTNALRHAGPASVVVTVAYQPDRLVLEVADDGGGSRPPRRGAKPAGGHGIDGMRERALGLGGGFDAGPDIRGGFRVRAWLPLGVRS
jgi:signal transduction histidine kinase